VDRRYEIKGNRRTSLYQYGALNGVPLVYTSLGSRSAPNGARPHRSRTHANATIRSAGLRVAAQIRNLTLSLYRPTCGLWR
jgi:hypothetical protein